MEAQLLINNQTLGLKCLLDENVLVKRAAVNCMHIGFELAINLMLVQLLIGLFRMSFVGSCHTMA